MGAKEGEYDNHNALKKNGGYNNNIMVTRICFVSLHGQLCYTCNTCLVF